MVVKGYDDVVHISKINKHLTLGAAKKIYLDHHPELKDTKITENMLMTSLLMFYLGENYEMERSNAEKELMKRK